MADKDIRFSITADLKLATDKFKSELNTIQQNITNAIEKSGTSDKVGKQFRTQFSNMAKDLDKLYLKLNQGINNEKELKSFESALLKLKNNLTNMADFTKEISITPDNFLPKETLDRVKQLKKLLKDLDYQDQRESDRKNTNKKITEQEELKKISKERLEVLNNQKKAANSIVDELNSTGKGFSDVVKNIQKDIENLQNQSEKLAKEAEQASNSYTKLTSGKGNSIRGRQGAITDLEDKITIKEEKLKKLQEKPLTQLTAWQKGIETTISKLKIQLEEAKKAGQDITQLEQDIAKNEGKLRKNKNYNKIEARDKELADIEAAKQELEDLRKQLKQKQDELDYIKNLADEAKQKKRESDEAQLEKNSKKTSLTKQKNAEVKRAESEVNNIDEEIKKETKNFDAIIDTINKLQQELADLDNLDVTKLDEVKNKLKELGIEEKDLTNLDTPDKLIAFIEKLKSQPIEEVKNGIKDIPQELNNLEDSYKSVNKAINENRAEIIANDQATNDVSAIQNRIVHFLSLENAINLAKRALRSSFETIKELDATMTETAVVTDFDISDMWTQLPQYTENANKLGVATNEAYKAATLYYQQGLKTNEVMSVSTETLKMARIAGIEAAQATDFMTAALRGFNMEINEASAQRVNDVYSKLAAITASNTQEISTAMTKVASLANNANMEFETTAAFLAQIVETTRESAETAGTALKTVVARFSEVKKLYSKGQLTGTDEEGEGIDVNKVSTALRSAGVDLNEYLTGMKGLDDIFMELASKWGDLDVVQQRYIATMAAGSRQQSRFIAMMSNYSRTVELVEAANNSAGASQQQFEKTLDSLQSKLAQLKNAWNEFTMGIANDEVVKDFIDLLTLLLNVFNKLTGVLPGVSGSFLKLAAVWASMKSFRAVFNSLISGFGKSGAEGAISFGSAFSAEWGKQIGFIQKLFKTKKIGVAQAFVDEFKEAKKAADEARAAYRDIENNGSQRTQKDRHRRSKKLKGLESEIKNADTSSEEAKANAIKEIAAAYDLEEAKASAAFEMTELGITLDQAAALAKDGTTIATLEMAAAEALEEGATEEQIKAKMAEIAAEQAAQKGLKKTVGAKLEAVLITKLQSIADKQEATSKVGQIAAWFAEKLAIDAANSSMIMNIALIGVSIGLIIGLIAIIKALYNAYKNNTLEAKLEAARERTKEAEEAAREAKQAYDDLFSKRDEYNELQSNLENLTVGTKEWKKALIEANQQVIDLISTYPELAKYLSKGASGQLLISEEGWDTSIKNKEIGMKNANSAALGANIAENNISSRKLESDFLKELTFEMRRAGSLAPEEEAYASNLVALDKAIQGYDYLGNKLNNAGDAAKNVATVFGVTEEAAEGLIAGFEKMRDEQNALDEQNAGLFEAELLSRIDTSNSKNGESIISSYATRNEDKYNIDLEKQKDEIRSWGKDLSQLQKEYAEKLDITIDQISEDIKDDENKLIEALAMMNISDIYEQQANELIEILNKKNPQIQQALTAVMSQDDSGLSTNQMGTGLETGEELFKKMEPAEQAQIANLYGFESIDAFIAEYDRVVVDFENRATNAASGLFSTMAGRLDEETRNLVKNMSPKALENFTKQDIGSNATDKATFMKSIAKLFKDNELSNEIQRQLGNELSNLDWPSLLDATKVFDILNNYDIDNESIKLFWEEATSAAKSYVSSVEEALGISSSFADRINKWAGLKERLEEGKATDEDIQELISAGADLSGLERTEEGWKLVGDAIDEAVQKAKEYIALGSESALGTSNERAEQIKKSSSVFVDSYAASVDENGRYQANTQGIQNKPDAMRELINLDYLTLPEEGESESDYWARAAAALEAYIKQLNELEAVKSVMEAGNEYVNSKAFGTADEAYYAGTSPTTTASDSSVHGAMATEAASNGLDVNEVQQYSQALQEVYNLSSQMADRIAIDNARLNQGVADLVKNYADWAKEIAIGPGNPQYAVALDGLKKAMNNILNISGDLSEAFYTNAKNMNLMKKAANGDMQAVADLRKEATKEILFGVGYDEAQLSESQQSVMDFINNFNPDDIEIGATLDDSGMTDAFNHLIEGGYLTAEQVSAALDTIGYEPEISYKEVPVSEIQNGRQDAVVDVISPITGEVRKATASNVQYFANNGMVKIPVVNGSQTKFKGPPSKAVSSASKPKGGGGGGGGGGGSKAKDWENPYDWLYNMTEKINKKMREREKIERRYQKLLEVRRGTASQLLKNSELELTNLKEQQEMQSQMLAKRTEEMKKQLKEQASLSKYGTYNFDTGLIQIDWDKINAVKSEDEGEKISKYISKLEEIRDKIQDAEDALEDIEDQVEEIKNRGKEEFKSLEDRIKESLENERQKEIDKLSEVNDSINDANSKLIEAMQKEIAKERQDRQNQKTEEDLSNKQRRLLYLQQDTSGANALEILKLQDEISKGQESYTDQLIDQKISELQEQNDKATEQRELQISIMEAQLKHDQEYGKFATDTMILMKDLMENKGIVVEGSRLAELLKDSEEFATLTNFAKAEWWDELQKESALAILYYEQGLSEYINRDYDSEIKKAVKDGKLEDAAQLEKERNYKMDLVGTPKQKTYSYKTGDWSQWKEPEPEPVKPQPVQTTTKTEETNLPTVVDQKDKEKVAAAIWRGGLGWGGGTERRQKLEEVFGKDNGIQALVNKNVGRYNTPSDVKNYSYLLMRKKYKGYKRGGMVDYTGPAWVDGTPSKPEIFLNSQQAEYFIQLRDVLSGIMSGHGTSSEFGGDNYYDVDINVEKLSNDYDVDQVAQRIKTLIHEDAIYRNVNVVNNMR